MPDSRPSNPVRVRTIGKSRSSKARENSAPHRQRAGLISNFVRSRPKLSVFEIGRQFQSRRVSQATQNRARGHALRKFFSVNLTQPHSAAHFAVKKSPQKQKKNENTTAALRARRLCLSTERGTLLLRVWGFTYWVLLGSLGPNYPISGDTLKIEIRAKFRGRLTLHGGRIFKILKLNRPRLFSNHGHTTREAVFPAFVIAP